MPVTNTSSDQLAIIITVLYNYSTNQLATQVFFCIVYVACRSKVRAAVYGVTFIGPREGVVSVTVMMATYYGKEFLED